MIAFIGEVNMSNGHKGLREIAERARPRPIDLTSLKPGQYVGFINKPGTAAKLFAANNVIVHYRSEHGKLTSEKGGGLLPEFMGSGGVRYKHKVEGALLAYIEGVRTRGAKARSK